MMNRRLACALFGFLAACGSDPANNGDPDASVPAVDAKPDAPSGFQTAPHDPFPIVQSQGGPVIQNPKIVPIFFTTEDANTKAQTEQYLQLFAGSEYWSTLVADYGVGQISLEDTVVLTDAPPTTDDALQTMLNAKIGTQLPAADQDTIYTVILPFHAQLSTPFGDSCTSFGGYHDEVTNGGANNGAIYALLPECDNLGSEAAAFDFLTDALSHEFFEASTDPHPFTNPAFNNVDGAHAIWAYLPGGELGDMCAYQDAARNKGVGSVGGFETQRQWSKSSAASGHDPCVPLRTTPFLGATPHFTETIQIPDAAGVNVDAQDVTVLNGQTVDLEVDLWTDGPVADYGVIAFDGNTLQNQEPTLSFSFDKDTGNNGDKLTLSITRTGSNGGQGNFFAVGTTDNTGSLVGLYFGYVAE